MINMAMWNISYWRLKASALLMQPRPANVLTMTWYGWGTVEWKVVGLHPKRHWNLLRGLKKLPKATWRGGPDLLLANQESARAENQR